MSFWAKVGVVVKDLDCFKRACEKNNIGFEMNKSNYGQEVVHANLIDRETSNGSRAQLIANTDGTYYVKVDTDARYSTLTKRMGKGLPSLMRDYSEDVAEQAIISAGGFVTERYENSDGSIVLKAAVGM